MAPQARGLPPEQAEYRTFSAAGANAKEPFRGLVDQRVRTPPPPGKCCSVLPGVVAAFQKVFGTEPAKLASHADATG